MPENRNVTQEDTDIIINLFLPAKALIELLIEKAQRGNLTALGSLYALQSNLNAYLGDEDHGNA